MAPSGEDASGEVTAVGPDVTAFKVGDRVTSHGLGLVSQKPAEGTFQEYLLAAVDMTAKIPANMPYTDATVIPLATSTASHGLYSDGYLEQPLPQVDAKPSGKAILIWGGSSSVGCMAIQLAKASGLTVVATASARNHDLVTGIGADHVVDHTSGTVVDEIVDYLKGKTVVGAYDAISARGTVEKCGEVLARSQGGKMITLVLPGPESLPGGVVTKSVLGPAIHDTKVATGVWSDFVGPALAKGVLKIAPKARILGTGLEHVQEGVDILSKGVSAEKLVIKLS